MSNVLQNTGGNTLKVHGGGIFGSAAAAASSYLLPSLNAISSLAIPLKLVNMHSDATSNARALHRMSYTGMEWDCPIGIHGGKFPYLVEIMAGPTGLSVGAQLVTSTDVLVLNYDTYRLSWDNPIAGSHTMSIRVTDQLGAQVTTSWTHVTGTANHLFINPTTGNNSTGDGTYALPWATDAPIWAATAGTYNDYHAHIHGGTLQIAGNSGNYTIDTDGPSILGVLGESPRLALSDKWIALNVGSDDKFIKGVEIFHDVMTAATADRKCISQLGATNRNQLLDLTLTHYEYGATNGANGAQFSSLGGVSTDQFCHNWTVTGNAGTVIQTFKHRNSLISNINVNNATLDNPDSSSNGGVIKLKDGWSDQTIRQCEMWDTNTWSTNSSCLDVAGQDQSSLGIDATDICYNKFYQPAASAQHAAIRLYTHNQAPAITNTHLYRNSLRSSVGNDCVWTNGSFAPVNHTSANNILENGSLPATATFTNTGNLEGSTVYFNASLNLTDRATNLGTKGAEVAA